MFLVVGSSAGQPDYSPYQVLFDDSAFRGDSLGENFSAWCHVCFFSLSLTSICDRETLVQSLNHATNGSVGSASFVLQNVDVLYGVLQFNITLQGSWTVYTHIYDKLKLGNRDACISD